MEFDLGRAFDALPVMVWTARPDGHIDFANRRWSDYTGFSLDAAHDWDWQAAIDPNDLPTMGSRLFPGQRHRHVVRYMLPVLVAALLSDAWETLGPIQCQRWPGSALISAYLRYRGKVMSYMPAFNIGLNAIDELISKRSRYVPARGFGESFLLLVDRRQGRNFRLQWGIDIRFVDADIDDFGEAINRTIGFAEAGDALKTQIDRMRRVLRWFSVSGVLRPRP